MELGQRVPEDHVGVVVAAVFGDFGGKPGWGCEVFGFFQGGEFHLSHDEACHVAFEDVKFDGVLVVGDEVSLFGDGVAVYFCEEVVVGFLCEAGLDFLAGKKTCSFVGQDELVSFFADANYWADAEIALLDGDAFAG